MAGATTYGDGSTVNREDLLDLLSVLEPEKTPVTSLAGKSAKPGNLFTEWGLDAYDVPEFDAVEQGADVTDFDNKTKNRERVGNYQQKIRRSWMVTTEQEATDTAGHGSDVAESKARCMVELKRDIESAICSDQEMSASNPTALRGIGKWLQATAQSVNPVPTDYLTPAGNINTTATGSLADSDINGVLQSMYENSGNDMSRTTLVAGPNLRSAVTNLQRSVGGGAGNPYTVNQDAKEHNITFRVDEYVGDYGRIFVVPTLFNGRVTGDTTLTAQASARGYLIDPDYLSLYYMKAPVMKDLEDQGAGPRGFAEVILSLCVKHPQALGKFSATS